MTRNTLDVYSDGNSVYAISKMQDIYGRIGSAFQIILLVISFTFFSFIAKIYSQAIFIVIALILGGTLISIAFLKSFLWGLWGKESLIITKHAISYQYGYGIFKSKVKTIPFDGLGSGIRHSHRNLYSASGYYFIFYNHPQKERIPETLYCTRIPLGIENLRRLDEEIHAIFSGDKSSGVNVFRGFSLN